MKAKIRAAYKSLGVESDEVPRQLMTKEEEEMERVEELEKEVKDKDEKITILTKEIETAKGEVKTAKDELTKLTQAQQDKEIGDFVDTMIKEGKILPKNKDNTVALMKSLGDEKVNKYSLADGKEVTLSNRELYMEQIKTNPNLVELNKELSLADNGDSKGLKKITSHDNTPIEDEDVAIRANEIVEEYKKRDEKIAYGEAISMAYNELKKQ